MAFSFIRWCSCQDGNHRIRLKKAAKKIVLLNHDKDLVERELVIASMGGESLGCINTARRYKEYLQWGWQIAGRPPEQLPPDASPDTRLETSQ